MSLKYYKFYKPFGVICQFSKDDNHQSIADYMFLIPKDVYPVGRLDTDSEGLILLTNDKKVNNQLLHPSKEHFKTYYVQVEGLAEPDQISKLKQGVEISVDGKKYLTNKCLAEILKTEPVLPERNPPIRFRKNIPTSWLSITITEGKNRQVRKMTAAVGLPTLRLVRYSVENISIENLNPGDFEEMNPKIFHQHLRLPFE